MVYYTKYGKVRTPDNTGKLVSELDVPYKIVSSQGEEKDTKGAVPGIRVVFSYMGRDFRTRAYFEADDVPKNRERIVLFPVAIVCGIVSGLVYGFSDASQKMVCEVTGCPRRTIGSGITPVLGAFGFM